MPSLTPAPRLRSANSLPASNSELSLTEQLAEFTPNLKSLASSNIHQKAQNLQQPPLPKPDTAALALQGDLMVPVQMKAKMLRAIKAGEYSTVWALLAKGANPNECEDTGNGWTPLHWAAKEGNVAICQLLVSKGAEVNSRDKQGQTPLHRAAYWGKLQAADFLVYVGASLTMVDAMNQTAAEVASNRNNQEVYQYLKRASSESTKRSKSTWTMRKQFEQLLKDQAKEEKLLKKNFKLEDKLGKLNKEYSRIQMLKSEVEKRGKSLPKKDVLRLEKLTEKLSEVKDEIRKNAMEVSISRCETFEKYSQETKGQTWMSFLEEM